MQTTRQSLKSCWGHGPQEQGETTKRKSKQKEQRKIYQRGEDTANICSRRGMRTCLVFDYPQSQSCWELRNVRKQKNSRIKKRLLVGVVLGLLNPGNVVIVESSPEGKHISARSG